MDYPLIRSTLLPSNQTSNNEVYAVLPKFPLTFQNSSVTKTNYAEHTKMEHACKWAIQLYIDLFMQKIMHACGRNSNKYDIKYLDLDSSKTPEGRSHKFHPKLSLSPKQNFSFFFLFKDISLVQNKMVSHNHAQFQSKQSSYAHITNMK